MSELTRILWQGEHLLVRRRGTGPCILTTHYGAVLDRFGSELEAITVASYCEEHGGSYDRATRNAAKEHWKNQRTPKPPRTNQP